MQRQLPDPDHHETECHDAMDAARLRQECLRVLRRLCETGTVLAVAAEMEKAVVVRDGPDGASLRTAVVDREVAEALALKGWIASHAPGRIQRYHVTQAGRAALNRMLAESENTAQGFREAPAGFDATSLPMPATFGSASSVEAIEQHRVIAEAISAAYHDYAEVLDDSDRTLSRSTDRDWDDYADFFVEWQRSVDQNLGRKRSLDAYVDRYETLSASDADAFNAFCVAERDGGDDDYEDFVEVDAAGWELVGRSLVLDMLKIHQRQIDAAGTSARALWFDEARAFYVPSSRRQTSNFMIDTMDWSDMVSHTEWMNLSADERSIEQPLPAASVFHTVLVNEVQIELGSEVAYVERIAALRALIDAGTATAEDEAALEGARFVFDQYRGALSSLAEIKRSRVRRYLRRNGADDPEWEAAERSKGQTALMILADDA